MNLEPVIEFEHESMIIKESDQTLFLAGIFQQWKAGRFCDIVLHVGNDTLKAHRCVLAATSTYFNSILKESKTVKEQLEVKCDGSDVLYSVLSYMYSGTIILNGANVCGILKLAVTFHLHKLKEYCSKFLETAAKSSNCLDVYELAKSHSLEKVKATSSAFIASHINEVLDGKQILEISVSRLEYFIKSKLWDIPKRETFPLIIAWVCHDIKNREEYFRILLTLVIWEDLHCGEIIEYLNGHPLFQESENCKSLLFEALNEHSHLQKIIPGSWKMLNQKPQIVNNQEDNENFLNYAISTAMVNVLPPNDGLFNLGESSHCLEKTNQLTYLLPISESDVNYQYQNLIEDDVISNGEEDRRKMKFWSHKKEEFLSKEIEEMNSPELENYQQTLNTPPKLLELYHGVDDVQDTSDNYNINNISLVKSEMYDEIHCFPTLNQENNHQNIAIDIDDVDENCQPMNVSQPDVEEQNLKTTSSITEDLSKSNCKSSKSPLKKRIVRTETDTFLKNCSVCSLTFRGEKRSYFKHMQSHFPGPPHYCNLCKIGFKRIYHLLDHLETHNEDKLIRCSFCSFSSRRRYNVKEHFRIKHSTEDKTFTCPQCCMGFVRKQYLEKHMTKHTNDRPMVCEICGSRWKTKDSLLVHYKTHTGNLHSCRYSHCAYRTPKLSHLKEHLRYHTDARPFSCTICDKTFFSKSHLKRHERKHNSLDCFQCNHCHYSASRLDVLKLHTKRMHNQTPTKKIGSRKLQFKKKDGFKLMNSDLTLNSSKDPNEELSLIDEIVDKGDTLCLDSYEGYDGSNPSSCTFETPGDPEDHPLMIVSEIEDNESLSAFRPLKSSR